MEAEITSRAVEFIKRNAGAGKPFFAYVPFSLVHMPTLPAALQGPAAFDRSVLLGLGSP